MRHHWQLDPQIDFLNHGSYGATPTVVLDEQRRLRDTLERNPVAFLSIERGLEPRLDLVRRTVADLVGSPVADIAFVRNATDGVNAVLSSLALVPGDEIVITDHGYNACNNAARFAAARCGATVRVAKIPFPIADPNAVLRAVAAAFSKRTRLLLVDHVSSPTGLVFPVEKIIDAAHARDVRVLVDGAHAAGMLPLNLRRLQPDYYTANHHKWLCAPKASGFLYVRSGLQDEVRPNVISHAASRPRPGRNRFLAEFDWTGTFDPTALLAVPTAIGFLDGLQRGGIDERMAANRRLARLARQLLCDALQVAPPAPDTMIGSMVTVPLPPTVAAADTSSGTGDFVALKARLLERYRIEVPVFGGLAPGTRLVRVSLQAYNSIDQVERLADALLRELADEARH
jgi:isopenicillin-N epimerase